MGWLRHPKTTQERRRWFADTADVALRAARSPIALPTVWDDIFRGRNRSWKKHRRTRWRKIRAM